LSSGDGEPQLEQKQFGLEAEVGRSPAWSTPLDRKKRTLPFWTAFESPCRSLPKQRSFTIAVSLEGTAWANFLVVSLTDAQSTPGPKSPAVELATII